MPIMQPHDMPLIGLPLDLSDEIATELIDFLYALTAALERHHCGQFLHYAHRNDPAPPASNSTIHRFDTRVDHSRDRESTLAQLSRLILKMKRFYVPAHNRAYEGDKTRQLALNFCLISMMPPKITRVEPWWYKKALYHRRNEVERLFRRLKGFRRIFSRFEKLNLGFIAFIYFSLIVEALRSVNTP